MLRTSTVDDGFFSFFSSKSDSFLLWRLICSSFVSLWWYGKVNYSSIDHYSFSLMVSLEIDLECNYVWHSLEFCSSQCSFPLFPFLCTIMIFIFVCMIFQDERNLIDILLPFATFWPWHHLCIVPAWLMNSFATKQRHVCILRSSKIYFSCTKPLGSLWIIKRAKDNHGRNIKILLFGLPWKVQSKIKYNQI